jgi:tyrosine-protein kinase Etk/Wzc
VSMEQTLSARPDWPPGTSGPEPYEFEAILWRRRLLVALVTIGAVLASLVISLTSTKIYRATASVVAPKENVDSGLLGSLIGSGLIPQLAGFSMPFTSNRDLYVSVLKSRAMMQAVAEQFKLQQRYNVEYPEDALKALEDVTEVTVSKEGVIAVRVEDADPKVAAAMANFYIERLDHMVGGFQTGEASRQRGYVEGQLRRAKSELETWEDRLRGFQEKNRTIVLQDQTRGAIEAAARLKGEILAAQVQLRVMQGFVTDANPEVTVLKRRIEEMSLQLGQMQYGDGLRERSRGNSQRRNFEVPFSDVPELGLELGRMTREVKIRETLLTLLVQQLEQIRIAEEKNIPVVQVLDRAVAASRHAKPRLTLNLAIGLVGGFLAGCVLALLVERTGMLRRRPRRA